MDRQSKVLICLTAMVLLSGLTASGISPTAQDRSNTPSLDFETYRTQIEPLFLKLRASGLRCYDCHSTLSTRMRLVPFSEDASSWTEAQSRKNFEVVSRLVTAGHPLSSPLALHPLAPEAGGDPTHTGGKFWSSRNDPEWKMIAKWIGGTEDSAESAASAGPNIASLDFEYFQRKVQPIFLKARPGHARCYGCHILSNRAFHLEPLAPGSSEWTPEQSRKNFQSAVQQVAGGDAVSSRLLMHPLAPEAGGEAFHSGGRQFASQSDPDWLTLADWVHGKTGAATNTSANSGIVANPAVRIYVTNSAGDTIDVVDAATNQVVQVIRGIELPHGIAFSPDGNRIYISNESESVLDVVDRESGQILKKIALSDRPNNLAITRDGQRVLVGIRAQPGSIDVIDTATLSKIKSIPVNGSVHNIYVTPDGKFAVSGSIENKTVTVIDLQTEQQNWGVKFESAVRPMTFEKNPDGSTRRIFVQLSNLNGFAVVDFATHAEVARIQLPSRPGGFGVSEGRTGTPSHGIGVSPDGKALWVNSTFANAVFKYSLPDLQLLGYVCLPEVHPLGQAPAGSVPEWITFTPDGKILYVSNSGAGSISAIDTGSMKEVSEIPVGEVPKRINMVALP